MSSKYISQRLLQDVRSLDKQACIPQILPNNRESHNDHILADGRRRRGSITPQEGLQRCWKGPWIEGKMPPLGVTLPLPHEGTPWPLTLSTTEADPTHLLAGKLPTFRCLPCCDML